MHVCMVEDFIQLSIKRPTDIAAGCALLAGKQQPVSLLPGLRPDSDSSRDFESRKVYPGENWAILKNNHAAHPKRTHDNLSILS